MLRSYMLMAALLLNPVSAAAQDSGSLQASASTFVSGFISSDCSVDLTQAQAPIDPGTGTAQDISEIRYVCNSPSGFTRRITSASAGSLMKDQQAIPYLVSQTGGAGLSFPPVSLGSPLVSNVPASPAIVEGTTGQLRVSIPSRPSNLLAGEYSDTVTIELTPN